MKTRSIILMGSLVLSLMIIIPAAGVGSEEYGALKAIKSVNAVFDFRTANPKSAVVYLDLIRQTFKDPNIRSVTDYPEFVVIFMGPAVKLISTQTEDFTPEEKESLSKIASIISDMEKDGIKLEICVFAAHASGVDPATILPEIKQVGNGWISLIGYEAVGYSLVPVY